MGHQEYAPGVDPKKLKRIKEEKQDPRSGSFDGLKRPDQLAMEKVVRDLQQDVWALRDFARIIVLLAGIGLAAVLIVLAVTKHTIDVNHGTGTDNHQILCKLIQIHKINDPAINEICGFKH